MVKRYDDLYISLGLSSPLLDILQGKICLPSRALRVLFADFGYPPALVPFWSKGTPMYDGLWRHWFCERTPTYVTFSIEFGYFAWEIGRTSEQLLTDIVCEFLGHKPLMEEVRRFAAEVGVDVMTVMECRSQGGFYRHNLLKLPSYASDPPRSSLKTGTSYIGDFPDGRSVLTSAALRTCCTTEFDVESRKRLAATPGVPDWFCVEDQKPLFDRYLAEGDLRSAWMCLNSHGWEYVQAKKALESLAETAADPVLSAVVAEWCGRPHERFGSY